MEKLSAVNFTNVAIVCNASCHAGKTAKIQGFFLDDRVGWTADWVPKRKRTRSTRSALPFDDTHVYIRQGDTVHGRWNLRCPLCPLTLVAHDEVLFRELDAIVGRGESDATLADLVARLGK